jgi:hypothetical protein
VWLPVLPVGLMRSGRRLTGAAMFSSRDFSGSHFNQCDSAQLQCNQQHAGPEKCNFASDFL